MGSFEALRSEAYLKYDAEKYDFRSLVSRMLEWDEPLSELHKSLPNEGRDFPRVTFENDQSTLFHKKFYQSPFFDEFIVFYHRFIREVIGPMFADDRIIFQTRPTFRVHLPNNIAVGQKHRDGDYNHPAGEINFWLPFTPVHGSNGVFTESEPDKGDFHPITLDYGEMFRFYGNQCWHYNEVNTTGQTRVSIDFRVIPGSQWTEPDAEHVGVTVKSKLRMVIGSYYSEYYKSREPQAQ